MGVEKCGVLKSRKYIPNGLVRETIKWYRNSKFTLLSSKRSHTDINMSNLSEKSKKKKKLTRVTKNYND